MRNLRIALTATLFFGLPATALRADNWPQFRGPNARGRPEREAPLPDRFGADGPLAWKTPLPAGHSSPAVFGDRVYITGEREGKLTTFGLDRFTGRMLWEAVAPYERLEEIHAIGSRAQSSPATDGKRVVSFFGSCGLFCYDTSGNLLWRRPMGPFKNDFGAASSPILVDGRVILAQDHDTDSFLMSLDAQTGEVLWRTDRSEFPRNFCTPVIWEVAGRRQIVLAATLRIVGYDFETGTEVWTVNGISRIVNTTPVVGDDGRLYACCWAPGGDEEGRITAEPFAELTAAHDANSNGTLEKEELPEGPIKMRFTQIDRDKDSHITRDEHESMRRVFDSSHNMLVAIRPGGSGDITESHVAWRLNRHLPYCPSPVFYRNRLFMVKSGGILGIVNSQNGELVQQGRLTATGEYFSSPVAGDGKVYLLSQRGVLTVISADTGETLSTAELGADAYATPAVADGQMFVRTNEYLFCYGPAARQKE
jgi:outer membrane protein assembly factor BamB